MAEHKTSHVVVFVFKKRDRFLAERRDFNSSFADQLLFPGGKVEDGEIGNIEKAMRREVLEELGVIPTRFHPIPTTETIYGWTGAIINPFLITSWQGHIPKTVLDKGNPLLWVPIDTMLSSQHRFVSETARALNDYLTENR
ncbi:NUDIX domain-containing protein [Candidatus Daviesbacteria bacterium]|nr:NUDIX domain-containing protein [Candidatus Daviesbacteria bacterium]